MIYDKIKEDVFKFRDIVAKESLHCSDVLSTLALELCLKEKGIKSTMIFGYVVENDAIWNPACWNKLEIDGKIKQIDIYPCNIFASPKSKVYTLSLCEKWRPVTGPGIIIEKANLARDIYYAMYNAKGAEYCYNFELCTYLANSRMKKSWDNVINEAKTLETFEHIEKFSRK
jgi:hypothetical protein